MPNNGRLHLRDAQDLNARPNCCPPSEGACSRQYGRAFRCRSGGRHAPFLREAGLLAGFIAAFVPTGDSAAQDSAKAAFADMEQTLGKVPSFFRAFPEAGVPGAWAEFKSIQLNPDTRLSGKQKELIGLAVAAQIPCSYCIYLHTQAAKLNGADDEEIREAVAMAAITRHWSTVLNGMQVDYTAFTAETDELMALAGKQMSDTSRK
jgi:AhpD family alkylhydroperoxidase